MVLSSNKSPLLLVPNLEKRFQKHTFAYDLERNDCSMGSRHAFRANGPQSPWLSAMKLRCMIVDHDSAQDAAHALLHLAGCSMLNHYQEARAPGCKNHDDSVVMAIQLG